MDLNGFANIIRARIIHHIDNSEVLKVVAIKNNNKLEILEEPLPNWIISYLGNHFSPPREKKAPIKDLDSIEEVKKRYNQLKKD